MKKYLMIFLVLLIGLSFVSANADDLSDVQQTGVMRLGVPPEYIPFVFYDEAGNTTGIDVALIQEIGRRMNVRVDVINLAFDGMIDSLNLGQVDIIGGAFAKTEERGKLIDFTRVYYNGDSQFIALSSLPKPQTVTLDSFRDLKIGVQKGTSFDQWVKTNLVAAGYASARNVYSYSSAKDEMRALDRKEVDLVVLSQDVYEDLFRDSGKYQIFYDGFMMEKYAFGLRKDSTLTEVVNGHLTDMIKDGTAQTIANRFFSMDFNDASAAITRSSSVPTPTPVAPVVVIPTQNNANCKYGMTFVSDVTITDGHQVSRGEKFRKVWRVKNTGTCNWTTNYTFVFVSGDQMSGRNINVPAIVQPGQTVDLAVDFTAPGNDGTYRSNWQMRNPQGQNFGETIWCKVRVKGGGSSKVVPGISAFYPDFYSGTTQVCPTVYWKTTNTAAVDIRVDGKSVAKSYSSNGSQQICGALQSIGNHTVELAALSTTDAAYSSFVYTTKKGEDGQRQTIPVINYFYPNSNSGVIEGCPTVYWSVSNSGAVDIAVDGAMYDRSYNATGAMVVCGALKNEGRHTVTLTAHSVTDDRSSSFTYVTESEGQKEVIPSVDYFYVNPDSGYLGDSTTAYWSVSNAAVVYITVDGNSVDERTNPSTGSTPISATIQNVGTHVITITARSVTTDTVQSVYYTMYDNGSGGGGGGGSDRRDDEGQSYPAPSIDYFYADPGEGTMGDSTTVYWSASYASSVDISVDGNPIVSGGSATGSAPVSATIQSVGTHSITIVAHNVVDDASSTTYYTMREQEEKGGYAGSNYWENEQGGYAGANYWENEQGNTGGDQGGYAGSNYVDDPADYGGDQGGYVDDQSDYSYDDGGGYAGSGYVDDSYEETDSYDWQENG